MKLTIQVCEDRVASSIARGSPQFHASAESLLLHLLATTGAFIGRPTDGILWEWEDCRWPHGFGLGIALLIDGQRAEPVRFELVLSESGRGLASGDVWFGDRELGGFEIDSTQHRDLVKKMLADRWVELQWKLHFRRGADGWSQLAAPEIREELGGDAD